MAMKFIELRWLDFLEKGMVYGLPNHFKGNFLDDIEYFSEKDNKLIRKGVIHRFPKKLIKKISTLGSLSTSGVRIEFNTTAKAIEIKCSFPKKGNVENMSPLAQGGMDVLINGKSWLIFLSNDVQKIVLPENIDSTRISLIFPTYSTCKLDYIKLFKPGDSDPMPRDPELLKDGAPVIFYGSSITQGGCSTRPSLSYSQQLCENLSLNYINFGVSGVGYGEIEVAEYLASFNHASLFVLDWGANLLSPEHKDLLEQRYRPFWEKIHKSNPTTPILFVGLQNYVQELVDPLISKPYIQKKRDFIENEANEACKMINEGKKRHLFSYCDGNSIIDLNSMHMTVDGVHPNDLGHSKYAEILEWKVIELLENL